MCLFLRDEILQRRLRDVIHFIHNLLRKLKNELVLNDCADPSSSFLFYHLLEGRSVS